VLEGALHHDGTRACRTGHGTTRRFADASKPERVVWSIPRSPLPVELSCPAERTSHAFGMGAFDSTTIARASWLPLLPALP
jgi:hypothetical protein